MASPSQAPSPAAGQQSGSPVAVVVPVLDDLVARTVAEELAAVFALGSAERDRDGVVPQQQVGELVGTGLLAITVPAEYGGADVSPQTVAEVFRLVGRADPNIAQVLHGHFVNAHLLRVAGNPAQKRFFFGEVLGGAVLGAAQRDPAGSGPGGSPAQPGASPTRLTRDEPGVFRLNGVKVHATGAAFARWLPTLARLDDGTPEGGEELVAFVPQSAAGVRVLDSPDDIGLRTAASARVEYEDVRVPSEHILRRGKALVGTHAVGSFAQLLHAAIEVGIAGEVLDETAQFVRTASRPAPEAHVQRAHDDLLLVQRVGELTVEVRAAEAALRVASEAITESTLNPSEGAATEAAVAVATVKILSERAALAVANGAFEVGGPAMAARSLNVDRHWRNARTHSIEDPVRWKFHHLGRYTLLGISPPRHRQI
jgi:alkylation response protein AidB-like acyl-CoA dehydrogenase